MSCEITQADNLTRRRRWYRKAEFNVLDMDISKKTILFRPMRPVRPSRPPDAFSHPMGLVPPCNDPKIGSYNHYHLSPNGIPRGIQRWYGLEYFIQIAGKPRIRPRELSSSFEVLY